MTHSHLQFLFGTPRLAGSPPPKATSDREAPKAEDKVGKVTVEIRLASAPSLPAAPLAGSPKHNVQPDCAELLTQSLIGLREFSHAAGCRRQQDIGGPSALSVRCAVLQMQDTGRRKDIANVTAAGAAPSVRAVDGKKWYVLSTCPEHRQAVCSSYLQGELALCVQHSLLQLALRQSESPTQ